MRAFHLNLASRPYRDYRPVYGVVVLVSLITAFLMLNNVETYLRYVHDTKTQRAKIAELESQSAEEERRADLVSGQLSHIDFKSLNSEVKYVNSQIAERAFSWSELLDRLEKVMPRDVRIVTLTPTFDKNGDVHLDLTCVAKTPDGLVDTINDLNHDPGFTRPFPRSETSESGIFSFTLSVDYHPTARRVLQ